MTKKVMNLNDINFKLKDKFNQTNRAVFIRSIGHSVSMGAIMANPVVYCKNYELYYLFDMPKSSIEYIKSINKSDLLHLMKEAKEQKAVKAPKAPKEEAQKETAGKKD